MPLMEGGSLADVLRRGRPERADALRARSRERRLGFRIVKP